MTIKSGVTKAGVQPPIWYAIGISEMIYRKRGYLLTVTSLTDSHADRPKSLHNAGMAADFRTNNVPRDEWVSLAAELKIVLDPLGYDVVLEADHIHCEYDPKLMETWIAIA